MLFSSLTDIVPEKVGGWGAEMVGSGTTESLLNVDGSAEEVDGFA